MEIPCGGLWCDLNVQIYTKENPKAYKPWGQFDVQYNFVNKNTNAFKGIQQSKVQVQIWQIIIMLM